MERCDIVEVDFFGDFVDSCSLFLWVIILWKDMLLGDLNGWVIGFIFVIGWCLLKFFDFFFIRVKLEYVMVFGLIVIVFFEFLYFFLVIWMM